MTNEWVILENFVEKAFSSILFRPNISSFIEYFYRCRDHIMAIQTLPRHLNFSNNQSFDIWFKINLLSNFMDAIAPIKINCIDPLLSRTSCQVMIHRLVLAKLANNIIKHIFNAL